MEALTTGIAVGVVMALIEVIKSMIEKFAPKKEDGHEEKIAGALMSLASSQERICETLDRVESRLEKTSDAVTETRLRIMNGQHH